MHVEISHPPEALRKKILRRRWQWVGGIVVVLLVGGMLGFNPAYTFAKRWRSRQLAGQAETFITEEKWSEAAPKARSAYQLKPDEPAAVRAVAHLESATGHAAAAVQFWLQLRELVPNSLPDTLALTEDYLRSGAVMEAEQEFNGLLAQQPNDPTTLRLGARIYAAKRQNERSLQFAQRAQVADPANKDGKLLLALIQLESATPQTRADGMQLLLQIAHERDKAGLDALTYLGSRRDHPRAEMKTLVGLLTDHPAATETHRLMALSLQIELNPEARDTLLNSAIAKYQTADPTARRLFGVWLNAHREYLRTLTLIPRSVALERKDLLLVHLDALAALAHWAEIAELLQTKTVPLDEVYAELFLARSAMELGQISKADLHWRRAHLAAAPSPEQMEIVGAYAEKIGQVDQAESAYKSLASSATTARHAYEALLRIAERKKDTAGLRDLLREMHERWPNDHSIDNDYAYVRLLLGVELQDCLNVAKQLIARSPASLPHRTTLALAYYRLNEPAAALAVYAGLEIPWERVAASQRAVHAAVLAASGRTDEAEEEIRAIKVSELRAEESDLLKPWQNL